MTEWRAVVDRDARFDGQFVYGVSSTKVFCRPSCPSRRPKRDRVHFFDSGSAAEAAGFRAASGAALHPLSLRARMSRSPKAIAFLDAHGDTPVTLATLAQHVDMSAHHLQRAFARAVGVSPREYHDALRQARFAKRLRAGLTVSRASYEAGYGSSSRVYGRRECARRSPPRRYDGALQGSRSRLRLWRRRWGDCWWDSPKLVCVQ